MNTSRNSLADTVAAIKPFDDQESEHQQNVLSWIKSGEQLYRVQKPDTPPKHLVSYFVPVDAQKKSVLLVDHIKAGIWLPPGGHVEIDENPEATVEREAMEELGIKAEHINSNKSPLFLTVTQTRGTASHTDVSLWYVLDLLESHSLQYDEGEFHGVKWFSFEDVLSASTNELDPHLHRFTNKLIASVSMFKMSPNSRLHVVN